MSFLGDSFKFENFRLGHMWDQIKSHPQRLLFGPMMDPLSTWIENKTTGSHFDPQSDQLGGAYGGRVISAFGGGQQGGIYKQAQDAGINTSSGMKLENIAHLGVGAAGAVLGGAALAGAGAAGGAGAGAAGGLTEFTPAEIAAMGGGTASGAGAGAGAAAASSQPSWMQYARWANQARGLLGGGAQQGGATTGPDPAEAERLRQQQIQEAIAQLGRLGQQSRMPMSFINSPATAMSGVQNEAMAMPYQAQAPGGY